VYYHFRKWRREGRRQRVWQHSLDAIRPLLNLSELNLDGSHVLAKKGGEAVGYQGRKKAKTTNILPLTEAQGSIVASTGLLAGNHNDAYQLKLHLQTAFRWLRVQRLSIRGAYFNADAAFDTREARKTCFNHGLRPNIPENPRNRQGPTRGRPRLFNAAVYRQRFTSERAFAWIDQFRALLIRFDRCDLYFLNAPYIAFAMINLKDVISTKA
jgi:hypothetical protein